MSACNIRNIDAGLVARLRVCAAELNLSIRQCVIAAIEQWIDGKCLPQIEMQPKPASSVHNAKTCRVYRCSQCIAAGKKF